MSFEDLIDHMTFGGKMTHEDWCEDEWVSIEQGQFVTETGELFTVSPWMFSCLEFKKFE